MPLPTSSCLHRLPATGLSTSGASELLAQQLVHELGVGLAAGPLHDLAHEEPDQPLLAAAKGGHLVGVGGDHGVDLGPDARVLRAQIEHLRKVALQDNVELLVLPWEAGAHPAMAGAFRTLDFEDPEDGDLARWNEGALTQAMAAEEGWRFPFLFDESQEVAKAFKAACTPDFFVFDGDQRLVYRGQLDDSRPSNDLPLSGKDVRAALDALRPAIEERDPKLLAEFDRRVTEAVEALGRHRRGTGYELHTELSTADLKRLSDVINALAEPVSRVAAVVAGKS